MACCRRWLCVHHVPSAGDRRIFAYGSICIASFCPTAVRFLVKFDYGKLCKVLLLAESIGIHVFYKGNADRSNETVATF
jgi:hypothetical protein